MKVLFSQTLPFFLAHGGTQTFIESLLRELPRLGVEVQPERWWDETQSGDIIHFIARPSIIHVNLAKQKGYKVVLTEFLDQPASRGRLTLFAQRLVTKAVRKIFGTFVSRLGWDVYREMDAMVYAVHHEWETAKYLFDADPNRGFVIPHGIEPEALQQLRRPGPESDYLISVATIYPRKNTHLLAAAAKIAKVPVLFVGKPYSEVDPYFQQFTEMIDDKYVRYAGFVSDEEKYELLRRSRGFALLSHFESGCIAIFEAAAAGLPLFLPKLPWATKSYPHAKNSRYVRLKGVRAIANALAEFYATTHRMADTTFPLITWATVAERYRDVYRTILTRRQTNGGTSQGAASAKLLGSDNSALGD